MGYIPTYFTNSSPRPYGQSVSETLCPAIMLPSPHKACSSGSWAQTYRQAIANIQLHRVPSCQEQILKWFRFIVPLVFPAHWPYLIPHPIQVKKYFSQPPSVSSHEWGTPWNNASLLKLPSSAEYMLLFSSLSFDFFTTQRITWYFDSPKSPHPLPPLSSQTEHIYNPNTPGCLRSQRDMSVWREWGSTG